jgi:hypothetical protein
VERVLRLRGTPTRRHKLTNRAIATGFERRYSVLKRLGATPLPRCAGGCWPASR